MPAVGVDRRQFLEKTVKGGLFGVATTSAICLASSRRLSEQTNPSPEAELQELLAGNGEIRCQPPNLD